jgi:hypothetical protein
VQAYILTAITKLRKRNPVSYVKVKRKQKVFPSCVFLIHLKQVFHFPLKLPLTMNSDIVGVEGFVMPSQVFATKEIEINVQSFYYERNRNKCSKSKRFESSRREASLACLLVNRKKRLIESSF